MYCDPTFWSSGEQLDTQLGHITWKVVIGVHPKQAGQYNVFYYDCLGKLLKGPRVSALGEVGIDFERASGRDRALQESTLRWILGHAREDVPLVLHLRGAKGTLLYERWG